MKVETKYMMMNFAADTMLVTGIAVTVYSLLKIGAEVACWVWGKM
jgi:hypothetical protein